MLAVFEKTVANSPEALQSPHSSESAFALKDGSLATHFASVNPNSVTLNFGSSGFVAYSLDNPDPRVPRSISSPLLFDYMLDLVKSLLFLWFLSSRFWISDVFGFDFVYFWNLLDLICDNVGYIRYFAADLLGLTLFGLRSRIYGFWLACVGTIAWWWWWWTVTVDFTNYIRWWWDNSS